MEALSSAYMNDLCKLSMNSYELFLVKEKEKEKKPRIDRRKTLTVADRPTGHNMPHIKNEQCGY